MKRLLAGLLPLALAAAVGAGDRAEVDTGEVTRGNTRFALELYERLKGREGNLFCSPFSISAALAMTSAGARGATLAQMERVLHLPEPKELHPGFASLLKQINAKRPGYQLRSANALWGQKGHSFLPAFVKLTRDHYGAGLREVDFASDAEAARQTINGWAEKETEGKVKDLLPAGVLGPLSRLVLTNAIFFKGDWVSQFKEDRTRPADFFLGTRDRSVKVPLMYQKGSFRYLGLPALQVLELPYAGADLSMVLLLPRKVDGLADVEKLLTLKNLDDWLDRLHRYNVEVYLPRFTLTAAYRLEAVLKDMGLSLPFGDKADFSGIDGKKDLYLSAVVHKAFVEVNEKGTKAAATTGAVVGARSTEPKTAPVFRADHPFVFLIRDRRSDSILFLGRLANPK
jgi:serpin B